MERRRFIVKAGGVLAAATAAAAIDAPNVIAQPKIKWRMATSWTPALDILDGNAKRYAKMVNELSAGRFTIDVFAAGELIPAFGVFDATSQGTIEMFNSAAYYWAGKEPATQWFTAVPFGMDPEMQYTWYYYGGGIKLWEEVYAPFGMVPRPSASTGPQMGGWFKRKINSMADLKGLKFRIPGLGGKVYAKAGTTVVLTPGGEIFPALERGVIDGSEWVGPHDDMKLGLHNAAQYYYYPGWHEPGTTGEFTFNKKAYEKLPVEFQRMLDHVSTAINVLEWLEYDAKNAIALEKLRGLGKVQILPFPTDVMKALKKMAADVTREESEKTPIAKKVYESYTKFQARQSAFAELSTGGYHALIRSV